MILRFKFHQDIAHDKRYLIARWIDAPGGPFIAAWQSSFSQQDLETPVIRKAIESHVRDAFKEHLKSLGQDPTRA